MIEFRTDSKWRMLLLLAIAVVFGLSTALPTAEAAPGDIYYVASDGDDSNPGTESQPWRTIQKAANTMSAGDSVIVLAGNYDERVQVTRSGDAGAPITYQADGDVTTNGFTVNADYITIKGFEVTATVCNWSPEASGIYVSGAHCLIEDNYAYYSPRGGIKTSGSSNKCIIRNNRAYRNGLVGIEVNGRDNLIEGNEIWGTIKYHPDTNCEGGADGIYFFGSGHTIRKNYIHDISSDDPLVGDAHIDCFQTWSNPPWEKAGHDIVFEQNFCENLNAGMYAFMLDDASNLVIRNNITQAFAQVNTWEGGNHHLTIVNNLFTSDLSLPLDRYPAGVELDSCPYTILKNNIFYNQLGPIYCRTGTTTGHDIGYNLAYRTDGQSPEGSPYPNDLWHVDPKFINAANGDFHLQSNSPAIDVGVTLAEATNDYDGNPRPQGAGYDIGAYEYAGGVQPTPTPQPTSTPTVTPQPTSTPIPTSTPTPTPTVAPVQLPLRINSAGQDYTDASGELWCTDQPYSPGGWGYIGGNTVNRWDEDPALNIAGTIDDPLYVAERYAVSGYQVDLPNGTYDVILHFAETFSGITGAGQRVFDVAIEGQTVLDDFDPFAEVGFAYATSKSVPNVMVTDGQLDITFIPNVQNPEINAIEVLPAGGIEPPASPWAIYLPIVTR